MKTLQFVSRVESDGQVHLPADVAQQVPHGATVRVVLTFNYDDSEESSDKTPEPEQT